MNELEPYNKTFLIQAAIDTIQIQSDHNKRLEKQLKIGIFIAFIVPVLDVIFIFI